MVHPFDVFDETKQPMCAVPGAVALGNLSQAVDRHPPVTDAGVNSDSRASSISDARSTRVFAGVVIVRGPGCADHVLAPSVVNRPQLEDTGKQTLPDAGRHQAIDG